MGCISTKYSKKSSKKLELAYYYVGSEETLSVSSMDLLTENPAFHAIVEKIFGFLNQENLNSCRLVSKSWKNILDNPIFWLKKIEIRYDQMKNPWNREDYEKYTVYPQWRQVDWINVINSWKELNQKIIGKKHMP